MADEILKDSAAAIDGGSAGAAALDSTTERRTRSYYDGDDEQAIRQHQVYLARRKWVLYLGVAGSFILAMVILQTMGRNTSLSRLKKADLSEVRRIASNLRDKPVQLAAGYREIELDEPDLAYERMKKVIRIYPDDFDVVFGFGRAAAMNGDGKAAIRAYEKATRLNPKAELPHSLLAQTYSEAGLYTDALREFEAVLKIDPKFLDRNNLYGECLLRVGRWKEAFEHLQKVIKLMPMQDPAFQPIALAAIKLGRQAEVEELVRGRIMVNNTYPYGEVRSSFARMILTHNATPERLRIAERQAREATRDELPEFFAIHAQVLKAQGKLSEALQVVNRGIAKDQKHRECLEAKRDITRAMGDQATPRAIESKLAALATPMKPIRALRERIKADPNDRQAYVSLAFALEAKQKYAAAAETMHALLQQKPDDAEAKTLLVSYRDRAIEKLEIDTEISFYRPQFKYEE